MTALLYLLIAAGGWIVLSLYCWLVCLFIGSAFTTFPFNRRIFLGPWVYINWAYDREEVR